MEEKPITGSLTSERNPRIKQLQKLRSKKYRRRLGAVVVEGSHWLDELTAAEARIEAVFLTDEALNNPRIERSLARLTEQVDRFLVPSRLMDSVSRLETPPGLLIEWKPDPLAVTREHLLEMDNLMICDAVQDPGNLGAMIRSADAFGIDGTVLLPGTVDPYNEKVVQATVGSLLRVPVARPPSRKAALDGLADAGFTLVAVDVDGTVGLDRVHLPPRGAYLFGNEAHGLSKVAAERVEIRIFIPMSGGTESLNVAAASAVLFYEVQRRRERERRE